jgi:hypothetical protein
MSIENEIIDLINSEIDRKYYLEKEDIEDLIAESEVAIEKTIDIHRDYIENEKSILSDRIIESDDKLKRELKILNNWIKDLQVIRGLRWFEAIGIVAIVHVFYFALNTWIL